MFDDYICEKIMRYVSGDIEDLNRIKQKEKIYLCDLSGCQCIAEK